MQRSLAARGDKRAGTLKPSINTEVNNDRRKTMNFDGVRSHVLSNPLAIKHSLTVWMM
jgi:hypothetical protein